MNTDNNLLDDTEYQKERTVTYGDLWEWWENRRLKFNTIVGLAGTICAVLIYIFLERPVYVNLESSFLVWGIVYAILANVSYFLGWIIDAVTLRLRHYPISEGSRIMLFRIWLVLALLPFLFLLLPLFANK